MKKVKNLIIGAGISGLTYANYAKDDYLIVEKENEVGGYCRTIKRKDYIWDYAGHFFHFKTDEFKKKFLDKMPKEEKPQTSKLKELIKEEEAKEVTGYTPELSEQEITKINEISPDLDKARFKKAYTEIVCCMR